MNRCNVMVYSIRHFAVTALGQASPLSIARFVMCSRKHLIKKCELPKVTRGMCKVYL